MPLSNPDCSISLIFQAVIRLICSSSPSDSYESDVKLRLFGNIYKRFLCVFQMIAMFICGENVVRKRRNGGEKMTKWWCGNCKNMVYLRRVHAWFPAFLLPRWRNDGAIAAVGSAIAAVSMCYSDDCDVYLR